MYIIIRITNIGDKNIRSVGCRQYNFLHLFVSKRPIGYTRYYNSIEVNNTKSLIQYDYKEKFALLKFKACFNYICF